VETPDRRFQTGGDPATNAPQSLGARPVIDEQEVTARPSTLLMRRSFDLSNAARRPRRQNCVDTPVLNRNGLTKSPASTWPNRAKSRSSTRFAVNSARSALAQSPNAASSTLCYLLRAFRHRSRDSAQTLQTGRPARHTALRVLVNRARLCGLGLRLRPPGADTGSHGEALSHPKAGTSLCPSLSLSALGGDH
jgi:hypothetical protein